jgi:hypothetical protein
MAAVSDPKDIRVLIPRMRRALDGPQATSSAVSGTLSDESLGGVIADAIAGVIFYSGGGWGRQLLVTARDVQYLAPIAWETDEALGEAEATVVIAEAALTHFHQTLSSLKTSEHIVNEGTEWEWATSASAVAERIKQLKALRDEALAKLDAANTPDEAWINTIAERDAATDLLIEPWVTMGPWGTSGGQVLVEDFGFGF